MVSLYSHLCFQVVKEQQCEATPTYHAHARPSYQPHPPRCRTVDRRVCSHIYVDKCVKTPRQQCGPGEPER